MPELAITELQRQWRLLRRYPSEVLGAFLVISITFYALLAGGTYLAGSSAVNGERLDAVLVGYWIWTIVLLALGDSAMNIRLEALAGTLEQLAMSPYGTLRIILTRSATAAVQQLLITSLFLAAMLLFTGRSLRFSPALFVPLFAIWLSATGIGLLVGGLALLFKRVDQLLNLLRFLMLFPVMVQLNALEPSVRAVACLLPVTPGAELLRQVTIHGLPLDRTLVAIAALNGCGYLLAGAFMFHLADVAARRRGVLNQF